MVWLYTRLVWIYWNSRVLCDLRVVAVAVGILVTIVKSYVGLLLKPWASPSNLTFQGPQEPSCSPAAIGLVVIIRQTCSWWTRNVNTCTMIWLGFVQNIGFEFSVSMRLITELTLLSPRVVTISIREVQLRHLKLAWNNVVILVVYSNEHRKLHRLFVDHTFRLGLVYNFTQTTVTVIYDVTLLKRCIPRT